MIEIEKDSPPTIDITAKEKGCDKEIKIFSKYVEIIYKNIPTKNVGAKVEGGADFPELQIPQQDLSSLGETTTVEETRHQNLEEETNSSEPEEETRSTEPEEETSIREPEKETFTREPEEETSTREPQEETGTREPEEETGTREPEEETSTREPEVQSIYHTYYSFSDEDTVTVYTRHFSRFNLYCKKHDACADYDANISAALFQKLEIVNDSVDVTVK